MIDMISNPLDDLSEVVLIHLIMAKTKKKLFLEVKLFWGGGIN